jgi:ectoine hydroxylase
VTSGMESHVGAVRPGRGERDAYPSRLGGEAGVLARVDPVVWPGGGAGPLGHDALARFERQGFLVLPGLLSPAETAALRAELDAVVRSRADDPSEEIVREPESEEIRSVFAVHRSNPRFARLAADRRLAGVAEQLLASRVYVHQSRVNRKPGFDGREFPWHSDFETWHVEDGMPRMRAVSMALGLTENTPHNGPLLIVPGSHHHYVACRGRTPEDHYRRSLRHQEYGTPDREILAWLVDRGGIEAVTGPPGSIVFFDCNAMHGSSGNITPLPRSNVFAVYNSVENTLVAPFGGTRPRPEHVASHDFTPLEPR